MSSETKKARTDRTPPDPELQAMRRIQALMDALPEPARGRVVSWLASRYADLGPIRAMLGEALRPNGHKPPAATEAK